MDWNHDGKVDGHDTTLYHMVINSNRKTEQTDSTSGSGRCNYKHDKTQADKPSETNIDSSGIGWVIAVVVIVLLYLFFS